MHALCNLRVGPNAVNIQPVLAGCPLQAPPPSEAAILSAARVIYASTVPSALRLTDEELAPIVAKNEHLRRKAAQHASVQAARGKGMRAMGAMPACRQGLGLESG